MYLIKSYDNLLLQFLSVNSKHFLLRPRLCNGSGKTILKPKPKPLILLGDGLTAPISREGSHLKINLRCLLLTGTFPENKSSPDYYYILRDFKGY